MGGVGHAEAVAHCLAASARCVQSGSDAYLAPIYLFLR
jgi:hypothetical protein